MIKRKPLKRSLLAEKSIRKRTSPRPSNSLKTKRSASGGKLKTLGALLKQADTLFSIKIRKRDGKCQHPKCKCQNALLQNSHFIGRAVKATRFDEDNCITLSWYCHYKNKRIGFEYQKQTIKEDGFDGQYTIYMKNWLGSQKYAALIERSKTKLRLNRVYLNNLIATLKEI